MPPEHLRPMILLFTDGEPTDDWKSALAALNQTELGQAARRIGIALGEMGNLSVLKAIAGDSVISVPDVSNIQGLSNFFTWMSASVRSASESQAPAAQIDPPPLPDWNPSV
jgi:uncharacterized protein YegL